MPSPTRALAAAVLLPLAAAFDNSCFDSTQVLAALAPPTREAPQTFLKDCAQWVVDTTDSVWSPERSPAEVNRSLREYFYEDWMSVTSFGRQMRGMKALEEAVWSTKRAFPDLQIHVTDVFCVGNDIDGYKTVMPDVLTGTNTGPSVYGPPTGKRATWGGIALCYVQRIGGKWQYVAEWVVHDELAQLKQLGLEHLDQLSLPSSAAATPTACSINRPSWGWQPPTETQVATKRASASPAPAVAAAATVTVSAAVDVGPWVAPIIPGQPQALPVGYATPKAKRIVQQMDAIIGEQRYCYEWEPWRQSMEPFFEPDFTYDTVKGVGKAKFVGLYDWFFGEHVLWNNAFAPVRFTQCIFAGEEQTATTTTYATAHWRGMLGSTLVPPTNDTIRVRINDFYQFSGERIRTNYMMLDIADVLRQAGRRVLPRARLPDDGWFQPPSAMEGVPAPLSPFVVPGVSDSSRAVAVQLLQAEWHYSPSADMRRRLAASGHALLSAAVPADTRALWADTLRFYGPSGIGYAQGYDEYATHVLRVLWSAFTDAKFALDVLSCEGHFCGAHGYLHATHTGCFAGEPPTGKLVSMRAGMHWHIDGGVAREGYLMVDMPALFDQLGVDLFERALTAKPLPPQCDAPPASGVTARAAASLAAASSGTTSPATSLAASGGASMWSNAPAPNAGLQPAPNPAEHPPAVLANMPLTLLMGVAAAAFGSGFLAARALPPARRRPSPALAKLASPLLEDGSQ